MTQDLAQTLSLLVGDLLGTGHNSMTTLRQVAAELPMEFGFADSAGTLRTLPPAAIQSRDLAVPVGQLSFVLDVNGGPNGSA